MAADWRSECGGGGQEASSIRGECGGGMTIRDDSELAVEVRVSSEHRRQTRMAAVAAPHRHSRGFPTPALGRDNHGLFIRPTASKTYAPRRHTLLAVLLLVLHSTLWYSYMPTCSARSLRSPARSSPVHSRLRRLPLKVMLAWVLRVSFLPTLSAFPPTYLSSLLHLPQT